MTADVTEVILTPGYKGKNCMGNGLHYDENGNLIECCCDECDYGLCCLVDDEDWQKVFKKVLPENRQHHE